MVARKGGAPIEQTHGVTLVLSYLKVTSNAQFFSLHLPLSRRCPDRAAKLSIGSTIHEAVTLSILYAIR